MSFESWEIDESIHCQLAVYKVPVCFSRPAEENMEGAKVGSTAQLEKHESAVVQIVAKESSQNRTSTKANGKAADASKTTQDKVPDTLQQALRKLVLLSQNVTSDAPRQSRTRP